MSRAHCMLKTDALAQYRYVYV